MITLALNISKLPIPELIEVCRNIVQQMTGNANFTTPAPSLATVTTAIDTLEATYQKGLNGDHAAKQDQKLQRSELNALMMELKVYVQTVSGDDAEIARTSGMVLKRSPERHNEINQPQNVRVRVLPAPGTVQTNWAGVPNRKSYLVYMTTDLADVMNEDKWEMLGTTGQTRFVKGDLTPGTKYAFIVVAVGSRNVNSAPSDPAIVMAA